MTLTRAQHQAISAIRTHFRETGCPPSLGDLSRRVRVSRQRACALVHQLERAGLITRRRGEALSIRLVGAMGNFSDDDLLCQMTAITEELVARGVDVARASISVALKKEFPLTLLELPGEGFAEDILAQLEGERGAGEEEADQDGQRKAA